MSKTIKRKKIRNAKELYVYVSILYAKAKYEHKIYSYFAEF